ncbi:MAG TPA: SHOCT domain-containing protein [Candidatus Saccharimonadales bacterium]|nr:SHOCT domain-containing protein [Candidatus Saccharimonadales bacterium]
MSLFKKALNVTPAYQAAKLGSKLSQQHKQQNQEKAVAAQSAQPVEAAQPKPKIKKLSFTYSKYLGGHSKLGKARQGNLYLTDEKIGVGTFGPSHSALLWTDVASVDVSGEQVSKSKIGATLVFGVFGGLAAKGTKNQAAIIIHTKDNEVAYYQIDKVSQLEAKAKITPLLHAVGVPLSDETAQQPQAPQVNDVTEQLTQLSKLKEQGILTEAEFTAKKKQLLGL